MCSQNFHENEEHDNNQWPNRDTASNFKCKAHKAAVSQYQSKVGRWNLWTRQSVVFESTRSCRYCYSNAETTGMHLVYGVAKYSEKAVTREVYQKLYCSRYIWIYLYSDVFIFDCVNRKFRYLKARYHYWKKKWREHLGSRPPERKNTPAVFSNTEDCCLWLCYRVNP